MSLLRNLDWSVPQTVEFVSSGYDPRMAGVGSSGSRGQMLSYGVHVPSEATYTDDDRPFDQPRYLIRLLAQEVPPASYCRVQGLVPYVEIGENIAVTDGGFGNGRYPVLLEQTSPRWQFPDGNVCFHLRWIPNTPKVVGGQPATARRAPFWTNDPYGLGSGVLYLGTTPPLPGHRYDPLFGGLPPGNPIGSLGGFWDVEPHPMDVLLEGAGTLVVYASVKQTNTSTRVLLPEDWGDDHDTGALSPEDRFLNFTCRNAIYTRVAARILADTGPLISRAFGPINPDTACDPEKRP